MSNQLLLISGGISACPALEAPTKYASPLHFFWVSSGSTSSSELVLQHIPSGIGPLDAMEAGPLDFGSLVHHCCLSVSDSSALLVGGGVPSFSFGEQYARSHYLEIDIKGGKHGGTEISVDAGTSGGAAAVSATVSTPSDRSTLKETMTCHVLFVEPALAKETKQLLLQNGYLDKCHRMIKTTTQDGVAAVALPITVPFCELQPEIASSLRVLEHGKLELPFSTSQFARGAQTKP